MRRSSKERRSFFLVVLDGSTPGGDMSCPQCMPALSNHAPHPPKQTRGITLPKLETPSATTPDQEHQQTPGITLPKPESPAPPRQGRNPIRGQPTERGGRAGENTANSTQPGARLNKSGPHSNPAETGLARKG